MRLNHTKLLLTGLLLALAPSALASTTWYVNGNGGSDSNNCMSSQTACKTIGHAISLASSGDTVMVASATYAEHLTINISLNLLGAGAPTTIIDGGHKGRVVTVANSSASVILSNTTVRNGLMLGYGGGISNSGTLTINNSAVSGNAAGGFRFHSVYGRGDGGGINNFGTLTINNSTISGNRVSAPSCVSNGTCLAYGGGIFSSGTLTINNSTVSGNAAIAGCTGACDSFGGGISNSGTVIISNSTIGGNGANHGSGIATGGTVKIQNSILANNSSGGNCSGVVMSNGYNISSDGTCNFSNSGDRNNIDPMVGPLQNNGGPTQTGALLPGSPAIDAGNPSGCRDGQGNLLTTDQRGYPRYDPEDTSGCDMGAYERQSD